MKDSVPEQIIVANDIIKVCNIYDFCVPIIVGMKKSAPLGCTGSAFNSISRIRRRGI
jgi:hypothetical protein